MLTVLTEPTPSLREPSTSVDVTVLQEKKTQQFIDQLIHTMYEDDGIGIAAPQVGNNTRIIIIGKEALKSTKNKSQFMLGVDMVLINPRITQMSDTTDWAQEGCLSVPGVYGDVERAREIILEAHDRHGNPLSFSATDFFSRVIQHEIDHLDGILFIDKAKNIVHEQDLKEHVAM